MLLAEFVKGLFLWAVHDHERWDALMLEYEGQGAIFLPFCLHRVSTQPTEIGTEYLCTLVAPPGQGADKNSISEDSAVQTTILENAIIGAEFAHKGWICNVPNTTLCGMLYYPLGLV